jgi:geranylgeranyl transferase type-2 subunit beta
LHVGYEKHQDPFEAVVTEHLKMNGVYWGLSAMFLIGEEDKMNREEVLEFVMKCYHECGGKLNLAVYHHCVT